MNTSKKGNFTPQQMKKPHDSIQSNGTGTIPLSYPTEPPDDENMNEIVSDKIDLEVLLPEGKVKMVTVDPNIPMMDLLVNLAASSRLNPAGHMIVVLSEETGKPREYKPNQTIGSLCGQNLDKKVNRLTIHLKSKKSDRKALAGNVPNAQPFETTYRFTINLPHKQKKVLRISPSSTLEQIHRQICTEKHFDPNRYHFQLTTDPDQELDMQRTVGELGTNEINLINTGLTMDSAKSMPDLSIGRSQSVRNDPATTYMPNTGEGKKKRGFFSIFKKDKKFNVQAASNERSPSSSRSLGGGSPPAMRRKPDQQVAAPPRPSTMYSVAIEAQNVDVRPKSMMIESIQETQTNPKSSPVLQTVQEKGPDKVAPPRTKKRRAPPPPQQQNANVPMKTIQVEISVEKQNIERQAASSPQTEAGVSESHSSSEKQRLEQIAQKLHSRNSSDSSGYHELTLSGAESPEAGRIDECIENDYKIGVDVTSIGSVEHLNGDSGIRDISPPRRKKHGAQDMDIGASQTLPLNKASKKDPARSRSLERGEQKMKIVGKKRKAAPPPPQDKPPLKPDKSQITTTSSSLPAQSQQSVATSSPAPPSKEASASLQPPVPLPHEPDLSQDDEDALAIEEVLGDLDRGLESPAMIMVENASLASEDIEVDKTKHPRPCSFVAPPPPVEPPPPDSQPVDYNVLIGHKVDTVDVGVETSDDSASIGPSSTKSSPVSIHSRPASRTSITSVNTIEDISMAFQLTIAAAEEAMLDSDNEEDRRSTSSLQMTTEGGTLELALKEEDELVDQAVDLSDKSLPPSEKSSPREETLANQSEDYEVSEITYNFTVDSVPTGFQTKGDAEPSHAEEEITVEPANLIQPFETSLSQEQKVSDDKEEAIISNDQQMVYQLKDEVSIEEISSSKVEVVVVQEQPPSPVVKEKPKEEPPKPKEKEVFVFKLDDLQDVNFSGPQKKKPEIEAKPAPTTQKTEEPEVPISPRVKDIKSIFQSENEGFSSPVIDWNALKHEEEEVVKDLKEGSVRDRCSELSFSPSSEGEQEHVLEEKSISMIALPAMRKRRQSPERSSATRNLFKEDTNIVSEDVVVAQETENVESSLSLHDDLNVNDSGFEPDVNGTDSLEPVQSNPLQEQFSVWQEQLIQTQKLLAASQNAATVDENSLQLQKQLQAQLQMQKMMMEQMQQSMAALTLQQQKQTEPLKLQPEPKLVTEDIKVTETIQPTPAAPPAAPPLPQNGMVHTGVKNTTASSEEKKSAAVTVKPKGKGRRIIEPPKLDPREELMIAIRNKGGISSLKKVAVNQTKWHKALS